MGKEIFSCIFGQCMGPVPTQNREEIRQIRLGATPVKKTRLTAGGLDGLTTHLPFKVHLYVLGYV